MTKFIKTTTFLTCTLSLLAFLGCEDKSSNTKKTKKDDVKTATVTILPHACEPMELSVTSGKTKFIIINKSKKSVEWEILKDNRIIDERENIIPGFKREITTYLDAGEHEMTCGLLTNPKGKLTVKLAKGASKFRKPTSVEFAGALGEYKVYTTIKAGDLLSDAKKLQDAIMEKNLQNAKQSYTNALIHYNKIESFLKQFSTLEQSVFANASLFSGGEKDEKFRGLHRIEMGLYKDNSIDNLNEFADELVENMTKLLGEVKKAKTSDRELLKYAVVQIAYAHDMKLKGAQNPYAKIDITSLKSNIDGSYRIFKLIESMLELAKPELAKQIEKEYSEAMKIVNTYKVESGYTTYENLSDANKQNLSKILSNLQANLEKLPDALGIN